MAVGDSKPIDFQLAIQGGGARLADLIAALEVIQQYEKDGLIRITRICGASAGAIAGAILACGKNSAERARDYLHNNAHSITKQLLLDKRDLCSLMKITWKLWRGQPLCPEHTILGELTKLFEDLLGTSKVRLRFSSLTKPLMVVTTNLDLREAEVLKNPKQDLVKALFDSSAFPLVLKGARQLNHPFVDGGLCDNLPSDYLVGEENKYGNVLAISFPDRPRPNLLLSTSFAVELLSTAIDNSIKRARARLPSYSVLEIATDIETFDFSTAFDKNARKADMELIRIRTKEWLGVNINARRAQVIPLFKNNPAAESIMMEIFQWYEAIPPTSPKRMVKDVISLYAHSLSSPAGSPSKPDLVEKEVYFAPGKEPVMAYHVSFGQDEQTEASLFDYEKTVEVYSPEGERMKVRLLPTINRELDEKRNVVKYRGYLIMFEPRLPAMPETMNLKKGAPIVCATKVTFLMLLSGCGSEKNLKDNPDEFVYEVPGTDVHKEVELVLFYPTDFYFRPTPRFRMGKRGQWGTCGVLGPDRLGELKKRHLMVLVSQHGVHKT